MKSRRASRRQSVFSIASSFFGPTALGSDISLDRQVSPEIQTTHVYFNEDGFSPSPYALSLANIPAAAAAAAGDASPKSSAPLEGVRLQGHELSNASPLHSPSGLPSPPAPSIIPSSQLTPAISGSSMQSGLSDYTTTTGTRSSFPTGSRRSSRRFSASRGELLGRKESGSNLLGRLKAISKQFLRSDKQTNKISKDPFRLRSTCSITAEQISPPDPNLKRKPTKLEKDMLKNQKKAEKYVKKQTEKRLRKYKREMKKQRKKDPEFKEAKKQNRPGKTEKLLKVMDDAKEKFWEWIDRREEKRRRTQRRAYTAMREERRKSVLLVPVERDYERFETGDIDGRSRTTSRHGSTVGSSLV